MSLRSKNKDLIFEYVKPFANNQFPTDADVAKEVLYHLRSKENTNVSNQDGFKETAQHVKDIWTKTGIPIIADTSIERKVSRIYDEYAKILKKKGRPHIFNTTAKSFRDKSQTSLFDISSCKCEAKCNCPYELKVPLDERDFLHDQRNNRNMFIGSIDLRATQRANINNKRSQLNRGNGSPVRKKRATNDYAICEKNTTPARAASRTVSLAPITTKRKQLNNVAREIQRCGVSLRNAATLFNALFKDLGLANEQNLMDKSQIKRNVKRFNEYVTNEHTQNIRKAVNDSVCCGLYFDGKKDNTKSLMINNETSNMHPRTHSEEHYSMVFQPHNLYYTHIAPTDSTAKEIAEEIIATLGDDRIDVMKIKFLGCDGTNVNTGEHGG